MAYTVYHGLKGTEGDDTMVVNHAAAAASEYSEFNWQYMTTFHHLWGGVNLAGGGNDVVIRDRPGSYRANPGDVVVDGGSGSDTISYAQASGGMDIDLYTGYGEGTARALGLHGQTIYGDDRLGSFENAIGSHYNDRIEGTNAANSLFGFGGDDTILGGGGNDFIRGGDHNDEIDGGSGNDMVEGDAGRDVVRGGSGNDNVKGGAGNDVLYGDDGSDFLYGGSGWNVLWGGEGNDVLLVEDAGRAYGGSGNDIVVGGAGADELHGDAGNDQVQGLGGNDELWGNDGNDAMDGGIGGDSLFGGTGLDVLSGGAGGDTIHGGANSDTIYGGDGADLAIWDGNGRVEIDVHIAGRLTAEQSGFTDTLWGVEYIRTGSGNDSVIMGSANNLIDLGEGSDYARGGAGNDILLGGGGNDGLRGEAGRDIANGGGGDDWIWGEGGDDTLIGGSGNDDLEGGSGIDRLLGEAGNDELDSGEGSDFAYGGSGADQFVFRDDTGIDQLLDFDLGEDMIVVTEMLHDAAWDNGSIADDVRAIGTHFGTSTTLQALTEDGWQSFAILVGHGNSGAIAAAIGDGRLFHGVLPNDDDLGGYLL